MSGKATYPPGVDAPVAARLAGMVQRRIAKGQDIRAKVLFGRGRFTLVAFWETRESVADRGKDGKR